jgi:hypothetical protein
MWRLRDRDGVVSTPNQTIPAGGSVLFETPRACANFGWVIALQTDQTGTELIGQLQVSYPAPGSQVHTLAERFNLPPIGCIFVPFPNLELTVTADAAGPGDVQVNLYPVTDGETAKVFEAKALFFDRQVVNAATTATIQPPEGATSYWVAIDNNVTWRVAQRDQAGNTLLFYQLGNAAITDFPMSSGAQYMPLFDTNDIQLTNTGGAPATATIVYQFDFRQWCAV